MIDRSSAVSKAGVSQTLMPANAGRKGMWFQNQHATKDLWLNELGPAAPASPSLKVSPGQFHQYPPSGIPATEINVYGDDVNQSFSAREW